MCSEQKSKRSRYSRVCKEYLYRAKRGMSKLDECTIVFETNKEKQVTCGATCSMSWSVSRGNERNKRKRGTPIEELTSFVDVRTLCDITLSPLDGICPDHLQAFELIQVKDERDRLIGVNYSKVTYIKKNARVATKLGNRTRSKL